jgi:4-amino-4-deoxy-L-arabinose transferase-like glycosyltransferase
MIRATGEADWRVRIPSLLAAGVMLITVERLGRSLAGPQTGIVAAVVCGSSILFLIYARQASYDMLLAACVSAANACLAWGMFRRRWVGGLAGAGAALGLALMSKGPVCLLQSLVPFAPFAWVRLRESPNAERRDALRGAAVGLVLMLLIALPWPLYILLRVPGRLHEWYGEVVLRDESNYESRHTWWGYSCLFYDLMPWTLWFIAGCIACFTRPFRAVHARLRLALAWVWGPILVMSFFPETRERYLVPMLAPASVLIAWAVLRHVRAWPRRPRLELALICAHVVGLVMLVLLVGWLAALHWTRPEGGPCASPALIGLFGAAAVLLLAVTLLAHLRNEARALVAGTAAILLMTQALFVFAYGKSPGGRSKLRPFATEIDRRFPDALVYNPQRGKKNLPAELSIYLDRPLVRWEHDLQELPPSGRPQIIIFESRSAQSAPPPGFQAVATGKIKDRFFHACLRERAIEE